MGPTSKAMVYIVYETNMFVSRVHNIIGEESILFQYTLYKCVA